MFKQGRDSQEEDECVFQQILLQNMRWFLS